MYNDIQNKLNSHELLIDKTYWAEMEARLQDNRRKAVPLWMWFAGTGIAASLALLLTVKVFVSENSGVGTRMTQIAQISADEKISQSGGTQMTQIAQIFKNEENTHEEKCNAGSSTANNSQNEMIVNAEKRVDVLAENSDNEIQISQIEQTVNEEEIREKSELSVSSELPKNKPIYDLLEKKEPEKENTKNRKMWQIAAVFGSGNNSASSNNNSTDLAYSGDENRWNSLPSAENKTPSLEDVFQPFAETTHLPPLSFGLTVRKNFSKHLALETGLTYTYLASKFKDNNQWQHRDATLKLHYLGIPLNGIVYLLNDHPAWNLYFSLGAMVEKGITLNYVQHTTYQYYTDAPVYTVSLQDDISGWQWSANASFGIGYKIYRDVSVYFEPKIMYYFKNNQPASARTEMPLLVGLNAGLRFEF